MTKHRWQLLTLLLALLLAAVAAGCGGDDDEEEGAADETTATKLAAPRDRSPLLAVWTGAEGEAFQAVLDGFKREKTRTSTSRTRRRASRRR